MSHENWTVIVFSLTIITHLALHDTVGEKVFNSKNIGQTFQLLFNVVLNENLLLAKRYAVDLFIDLLKEPKLREYLASYHNFKGYISQVFGLLDGQDTESINKILDLLYSIITIPELRRGVFDSMSADGMEDEETQLTDPPTSLSLLPLLTLAGANQSKEFAVTTCKALGVVAELCKEIFHQNGIKPTSFPLESCLKIFNEHLALPEEKEDDSTSIKVKAKIVARSIQSLIMLSRNNRIKNSVLNFVDMARLVSLLAKLSQQYSTDMRCGKKDHNNVNDDVAAAFIFGSVLLKDICNRTENGKAKWRNTLSSIDNSPFLTSGLCSGSKDLVAESFNVIFDLYSLDATARDSIYKLLAEKNARKENLIHSLQSREVEDSGLPYLPKPPPVISSGASSLRSASEKSTSDSLINHLAEKVKNGLEIKDSKVSEIMEIYEHKLLSSETKENHLQDLLEAKTLALNQADRLLAQYRCRQAQSEAECLKLRSMINETERKCERQGEEMATQREELRDFSQEIASLQDEVASLTITANEHRELKVNYTEMKKRLNEQLFEIEKEKQAVCSRLQESEQCCNDLRNQLSSKDSQLKQRVEEHEELKKELEGERCKHEKQKTALNAKVSRLDLLCQQRESELREKEKRILFLQTEVDKHSQIAAMIHNLSSGKIPVNQLDFKS